MTYNETIDSAQLALDTMFTNARRTVYIDGIPTDTVSHNVSITSGTTGTCTLVVPLPAPAHIVPNAEVRVWDGHQNLMGVRFWGRIPRWSDGFHDSGNLRTITAVGWSSLLAYRDRFDLVWPGPISISEIFDAVCSRRGVPSYKADIVYDYTGTVEVKLGTNPYVEEGMVTIPAGTTPLSWLQGAAEPFGYSIYDSSSGMLRLTRISGEASSVPAATFTEGENIFHGDQVYDTTGIINYHDVQGVTYEDEIGRSVPIRAIPLAIPSNPLIPVNDGINYQQYRNSLLVTQQLAEIVRNRLEIDLSAPDETIRWATVAIPSLSPGDPVRVISETLELDRNFWLTRIDTNADDSGLVSTYEGWSGGGDPLPAGNDRVVISLQGPAVHLGDENVAWYAHPAPQGKEMYWDFSIPKRATAVNVVFKVHGSNSQYIGGVNEDLTVSKFDLYKLPIVDIEEDDPHSSGSLPVLDENYAQRYKYATDDTKWSPGAIALKGFDEEEVDCRLYLRSGENSAASLGPWDDFEIKDMYVEIYGTVEPVILPAEEL